MNAKAHKNAHARNHERESAQNRACERESAQKRAYRFRLPYIPVWWPSSALFDSRSTILDFRSSIFALRFSLLDSRSSIFVPRFSFFDFRSSILALRFSLLHSHSSMSLKRFGLRRRPATLPCNCMIVAPCYETGVNTCYTCCFFVSNIYLWGLARLLYSLEGLDFLEASMG